MPYGLQIGIRLCPDGRSARSDRTAIGLDPARLEAQYAAGRDRFGQNFHGGQRHQPAQPADPRIESQQDPRGTALRGVQELFPGKCGRILRFLLRLLSARSLPTFDGYLYRKGPFDQRRNRKDAFEYDRHPALGAAGRHRRFQRIVSVRLRQSERFPLDGHSYRSRRNPQLQAVPLQTGRSALYPDRTGTDPRDIPRDGRHDRHHGGFRRIRQPVFPRHLFRQRSREHPEHRPRNRPADPNARRTHPLPSEPVCHDQGAHTHGRAADLPRPGQANRLLRASGTSGRSAADQAAGGGTTWR